MPDGRHSAPRGRSSRSEEARKRALANEQRLIALGDAVDRRSGVTRKPRRAKSARRKRIAIISGVVTLGLVAGLLGGGYLYAQWRYSQIPKLTVKEQYVVPGQPFNILSIGSDSRVGLTGSVAAQTGANSGQAAGQRSDVVKIMHVDPVKGTITILSIPRDTTVTLLANQSLYGQYNRINVNYSNGPSLLAQTITANFGIPINHVVQVGFAGMINAATAIGGVYLDFPYPSFDPNSDLQIRHAGCQLVTGAAALAVARSRHFFYLPHGTFQLPTRWAKMDPATQYAAITNLGWVYDGTSDYGRIDRQNAFLRAMFSRVKSRMTNVFAINSFLSKVPQGVAIDSKFGLNEMIGLALKFRHFNPAAMRTYTLPTTAATVNGADLLFVQQPAAQQLLVSIFGSQLLAPTNPPPNAQLQTPMPPVVTTTTAPHTTTTVKKPGHPSTSTTTTTNPTLATPFFDPVPCNP
jgi:LCP family protein required for cell wall assembly